MPAENQSPVEGRYMVARAWSRISGGTPGKRTSKPEPRLRGDIMRGLNMGGVNTYNALIQSATLCHPYGVRIYFAYFPGFRRWRGSTPGLFYGAPNGAQKFGSLTLAGSPPQLPICEGSRVFRDSHITQQASIMH